MIKFFINLFLLGLSAIIGWCSIYYFRGELTLLGVFVSGLILGTFLMNIRLNVKNDRINSYKRELEKESVNSDEAASRVKVLESKIEVLEKALEKALNN